MVSRHINREDIRWSRKAVSSIQPQEDGIALSDLSAIFAEATGEGIRFCSWKSNQHVAAGLAGDTDVDLLVAPESVERLRAILRSRGCLEVAPPPDGNHPGMSHFVGKDSETSTLFHLHIQNRLILGQRYSKNHVLPLDETFLDTAEVTAGVPQADPALELVVLATRALLKYRARDAVKDVLLIRTPGIPESTLSEVSWCLRALNEPDLDAAIAECSDVVPPDIVRTFLRVVRTEPRSGLSLWRLKRKLEAALAPYQRRSRLSALLVYAGTLGQRRLARGYDSRLRLESGLSIAIVGPDGSGKTTLTSELSSWLGNKLAVNVHYLGSKQPSLWTDYSYLIFRIFRRAHRDTSATLSERSVIRRFLSWWRDVMLATHHLLIARDRLRRLKRKEAEVADGRIVLLDRYPLEAIGQSKRLRLLDGPSIDPNGHRLVERMARLETRMYERFGLPDGLVLLKVDPRIAIARKPDHDPAVVEEKAEATSEAATLMKLSGNGSKLREVDSNLEWPKPLIQAKEIVWEMLSPGAAGEG